MKEENDYCVLIKAGPPHKKKKKKGKGKGKANTKMGKRNCWTTTGDNKQTVQNTHKK